MSLPELDNLVRIGNLKAEPRNALEVTRMLEMARTRLADAQLHTLSLEGHFTSAYNAAHQKRNLAEYEGYLEIEESTVTELCALAQSLLVDVQRLTVK